MKKLLIPALLVITSILSLQAQTDLSYYLPPQVQYDPAIPTPRTIIGHEVGEWHVTHDKLVNYMMALDKASERITLEITGYTHEARPLLLLTITAPKNHQNIEAIRLQHLQLGDASKSGSLDVKNMPAVFYLGCSIHGNEASGANAGLVMAYHLAAAQGPEIEKYLENTVILFDPSFNPDGLQRFSGWVNSRKSKVISTDANDTEHNEAWPGGRLITTGLILTAIGWSLKTPNRRPALKNFRIGDQTYLPIITNKERMQRFSLCPVCLHAYIRLHLKKIRS